MVKLGRLMLALGLSAGTVCAGVSCTPMQMQGYGIVRDMAIINAEQNQANELRRIREEMEKRGEIEDINRLVRYGNGVIPPAGYTWVNPNANPPDYRIKPINP